MFPILSLFPFYDGSKILKLRILLTKTSILLKIFRIVEQLVRNVTPTGYPILPIMTMDTLINVNTIIKLI